MKKRLFYLVAATFVLAFSGFSLQSCDDDDDGGNVTIPGNKIVEVRVVDETGALTTANVVIKKDGTDLRTQPVAGSYTMDVSSYPKGTLLAFKATRTGYTDSNEQSVTLDFSTVQESWSSYVVLQISKKSQAQTIDPTKDNVFEFPSLLDPSRKIVMTVPAGATGDVFATLTPTKVPTAASRGVFENDAPGNTPALEILDFESSWTGEFANGKKVSIVFPLTQAIVDLISQHSLTFSFGTNSGGSWEAYPLTIDPVAKTGTVWLPHFSKWYLTTGVELGVVVSQTDPKTLGTSDCGAPITVTFTQENNAVPTMYTVLFGITTLPSITQNHTEVAEEGYYTIVRGRCIQTTISFVGRSDLPSLTYFRGPVTFTATPIACDHSGGGGN